MKSTIFVLVMAGTFIFLPLKTQAADTTIKGTGATSATAGLEVTNSSDTSLLYVRNDGNVGIGTTAPGQKFVVLADDGTQVVVKKADGNVGIGTTNPKGKLDVAGGISAGTYAGVNTPPSNGMIISGNVGIGTTAPAGKLHIIPSDSVSDVGLVIKQGLTSGTGYQTLFRVLDKNGIERVAILSQGADGLTLTRIPLIQTTPIRDANGIMLLTSASAAQFLQAKGIYLAAGYTTPTINPGEIETGSGVNLTFSPGGNVRMTLLPNGNVGIGTTGPNAKFVVSGGSAVVGTAALATTATDGFLYIPSSAGSPTGTPTTQTGTVPIEYDTTNNRLYAYRGGAWHYFAETAGFQIPANEAKGLQVGDTVIGVIDSKMKDGALHAKYVKATELAKIAELEKRIKALEERK